MKKLWNNKIFKNFTILFIFTMILEILFRVLSGIKVFDISILRILIGTSIFSLFLGYLFSLLSNKKSKIAVIIVASVLTIYAFLQLGFKNFLGVYVSFNTSSQLGAVVDYIREFFKSFLLRYYFILIPLGLLLIYYLFIDKYTILKEKKFVLKLPSKHTFIIASSFAAIVLIVLNFIFNETLTASFMKKPLQTLTAKELYDNPSVPSAVVNEFGVIGFGLLDIKSLFIKPDDDNILYNENDIAINSNNQLVNTNRVVDDHLFKNVSEKEKNKTYKSINNYILSRDIPDYNKYSGMFEGKNLIMIMGESVNEIFINKEYFPNFYKLYNEGISFTNNYSPRNSCSTGNNEFSGLTGLYTIYNNCTANIFKNNTYFTSLFNLFNRKGYNTLSMHNYTEAYYRRRTIHPNLGSMKYYGVEDLGIEYHNEYRNWSSDEDFMKSAMDITLQDTSKPFMLWLTTVSSHQPYVVPSIEGDKHYDLFKDLWPEDMNSFSDPNTDLKRYLSKLKTLDLGLGVLLDRLEEAGILDDTVIVFYGDHYPYGLKNNKLNKILPYDLGDYETERVPCTIYNSKITPQVVEKYTSFINLTPTLANLFGLDYDPRMYMGSDILADDYLNIVTFPDGSWKNDKAFYDASNGQIKYYQSDEYSIDKIKEINNIVTDKLQMSSLIIRNNYYSYLEKKLNLEKQSEELNQNINIDEKGDM